MKCQVTSKTTHDVLISKEVSYKSFKEICSGEPKKVNLGYNYDPGLLEVENNSLVQTRSFSEIVRGGHSYHITYGEVLSIFFSIHKIQPNWLNCGFSWGWYDENLGGWTGCMGKV